MLLSRICVVVFVKCCVVQGRVREVWSDVLRVWRLV